MTKIQNLLVLEMLLKLRELKLKHYVKWLTYKKLKLIELFPIKENLINLVWRNSVIILIMIKLSMKFLEKISFMQELVQENNWMIFHAKFNSYEIINHNILAINLLQMWHQESILKEKDYKPFWTPVYQELSEKLLLPIKIDYADLDLTSSKLLLQNQEAPLQSSMIKKTKVLNKNCQKTYYQLSTSTVVNKWEKEVINQKYLLRTIKVQLILTPIQRDIINEWIDTSRYIYNKTIETINNNENKINFYDLRTLLVTNKTKTNNPEYIKLTNKIKKKNNKIKKIKVRLTDFNNLNNKKINLNNKIANIKSEKLKIKYIEEIKNIDNELQKYNKYLNGNKTLFLSKINLLENKIIILKKQLKETIKNIQPEVNKNVKLWELNTPKEIRAGAVNDVCKAYKTCFTLLKNNNIKYFNMKFKKKTDPKKCIIIQKNLISIENNNKIKLAPSYIKDLIKIKTIKKSKNKRDIFYKNFKIENDCRLIKDYNKYYLCIPIKKPIIEKKEALNYCGIDPGIRTFMNVFSNNGYYKYEYNKEEINKINKKIYKLTGKRKYNSEEILKNKIEKLKENIKKRKIKEKLKERLIKYENIYKNKTKFSKRKYRKKTISKYDKRKSNLIDELHWKTINDIVKNNDYIFYGDIKSHNIVKNKNNHNLNKNTNDLKFYKFKQRLIEKVEEYNKQIYIVNEAYTTQTCSYCGNINKNVKSSEIYKCTNINCNIHIDRDMNAAKNILMKGIIYNLR